MIPSREPLDVVDRVDEQRRLANAIRQRGERHGLEQRTDNLWSLVMLIVVGLAIIAWCVVMAVTARARRLGCACDTHATLSSPRGICLCTAADTPGPPSRVSVDGAHSVERLSPAPLCRPAVSPHAERISGAGTSQDWRLA